MGEKKETVKPSWKNQKADASVIELGKGNRNLVMGVTGTRTSINLGGRGAVGCLAQMSGARDLGARDSPRSKGPGPVASLGAESLLQASESPAQESPLSREPPDCLGHEAHPRAASVQPEAGSAPAATTCAEFYYPSFTILTGKTNLKHLEIYVSDGSSCTIPLY